MALAIFSTIKGETPSDGSSSSSRSGLPINVRATVSICCSPPLMRPPSRFGISARLGNSANRLSGVQAGAGVPSAKTRGGWRPTSRFSITVRSAKMRRSSGVKPKPRRAISYGFVREMSSPVEAHAARAVDQAHDRFHGRRLAGAVAAHQRDHFAAPDLEVHIVKNARRAVPGAEAVQRRACGAVIARPLAARTSCRCRNRPRAPADRRGSPRHRRRRSARPRASTTMRSA